MSDLEIPQRVLEAARTAFLESRRGDELPAYEASLRAALKEWRVRIDDDDGHNSCYRLVSDWQPKP